jgi:predicted RNase H-like nuclease
MYIGIDGCPSGWLVVRITEDDSVSLALYDNIQNIWNDYPDVHLILIDIPIGLPDSGNGTRTLPESPPHDINGLPMEMVYWKE